MDEIVLKCQMLGCHNMGRFLIRSLRGEVGNGKKWLYVCDACEKRLAAENAQVIGLAQRRGISVAEYVQLVHHEQEVQAQ